MSALLSCAPLAFPAPGTSTGTRSAGADALEACARSFSADTEVVLGDGTTKPIAEVEVGDWVLATDPETGETGIRKVTGVWVHDDELVDLEVDGESLTTTEDHHFWNGTDDAWQEAQDLDEGDMLLTADGTTIPVGDLLEHTVREAAAYNLTVDGLHTYYVATGEAAVLVHNCAPPGRPDGETVFSGHGGIDAGDTARTRIPDGTCIKFYCAHGDSIYDDVGNAIEEGVNSPRPTDVYGPGDSVPDYWLEPPFDPDLNITGAPTTVDAPTRLSDLLKPDMGTCHWAACRDVS